MIVLFKPYNFKITNKLLTFASHVMRTVPQIMMEVFSIILTKTTKNCI